MVTKHNHKLKRHRFKSGNEVYFCALPECTYKITPALSLGKRVICWRCGESFIMGDYSIRLAKPHCDNCHKPKIAINDVGFNADNHISIDEPIPIITTPSDLKSRLSSLLQQKKDEDVEI